MTDDTDDTWAVKSMLLSGNRLLNEQRAEVETISSIMKGVIVNTRIAGTLITSFSVGDLTWQVFHRTSSGGAGKWLIECTWASPGGQIFEVYREGEGLKLHYVKHVYKGLEGLIKKTQELVGKEQFDKEIEPYIEAYRDRMK